jgi:hypothetical protein
MVRVLANEIAKHRTPKVSSCGHDVKWVNGQCNDSGCTIAFRAIYSHPANE